MSIFGSGLQHKHFLVAHTLLANVVYFLFYADVAMLGSTHFSWLLNNFLIDPSVTIFGLIS
jgi:hypothetical protein